MPLDQSSLATILESGPVFERSIGIKMIVDASVVGGAPEVMSFAGDLHDLAAGLDGYIDQVDQCQAQTVQFGGRRDAIVNGVPGEAAETAAS